VLEVERLQCRYGKVVAVREISLQVHEGELVTLIGANGAGKTTTLKAISGLLKPAAGRILFAGKPIHDATTRAILTHGIAHCPEGRRVFPHLTVLENLEMGAYLRKDARGITQDLQRTFQRFPILEERKSQAAGTLSGGEQQLLAISRALMSRPKLMLFDEPSLGLAPKLVETIFDIIREVRQQGVTVLMVEQNAYAALEMADRSYLLEAGEVALEGTGEELLTNPHVKAAYLGG
jgi:branched-chain amino acid transport system ATP-binding protein